MAQPWKQTLEPYIKVTESVRKSTLSVTAGENLIVGAVIISDSGPGVPTLITSQKEFLANYASKDLTEDYIVNIMNVNATAVMRLVSRFYDRIASSGDFYCGVMVSIAGFMSSPFFSVYGASKAALKIFIESVNVELEKAGFSNRILNVSPGSIKGTGFSQGKTDLSLTEGLAKDIIQHLESKDDLFIPQYEEVFKTVLQRYHDDFRAEGRHSYDYKLNSGRVKNG